MYFGFFYEMLTSSRFPLIRSLVGHLRNLYHKAKTGKLELEVFLGILSQNNNYVLNLRNTKDGTYRVKYKDTDFEKLEGIVGYPEEYFVDIEHGNIFLKGKTLMKGSRYKARANKKEAEKEKDKTN